MGPRGEEPVFSTNETSPEIEAVSGGKTLQTRVGQARRPDWGDQKVKMQSTETTPAKKVRGLKP